MNTNKKNAICKVGGGYTGGAQTSTRLRTLVAKTYRGRQGD